jgi:hypothetical protein
MPVDALGEVAVDCGSGDSSCERRLLDAVCARGGNVAWGLARNDLSSRHLTAHAAHSKEAQRPSRERGCDVQVFADAPPMPTRNIGVVTAGCNADDSESVCTRELLDQVCLLGGDVVWQVEGPYPEGDKKRMRGRAAQRR